MCIANKHQLQKVKFTFVFTDIFLCLLWLIISQCVNLFFNPF